MPILDVRNEMDFARTREGDPAARRAERDIKKRGAPGSRRLRPGAERTDRRPGGAQAGLRSRRGLDAVAEGAERDIKKRGAAEA